MNTHADIIVVGGGPVGALAALKLQQAGRDVLLIEARAEGEPPRDARALALSWYSQQQLAAVQGWPQQGTTAIDGVHVSQQGVWGRTVLTREDLDLPHLGAVVDYPALMLALEQALRSQRLAVAWQQQVTAVRSLARYATVTVRDAAGTERTLTARLVVLAEGGSLAESLPGVVRRVHDYRQSALLAEVSSSQPHRQLAYERFADAGPLALLPYGERQMLVWTRSQHDAERLADGDGSALLAELQQAFGERLGRFTAVGPRALFPLRLRQLNRVTSGRVVMIGNAAQTMHPVAAQGFNLGLRDAVGLAELLATVADPGDAALLRRYAASRRVDSHAVVGFTHGLIQLFDGKHPLLKVVRGVGMNALDSLPPLRKAFAGHLVFGV